MEASAPLHDPDLVWEVLKWLPVKSLMRFKCVSKNWNCIVLNPSFARAYRGGFRGLVIVEPRNVLIPADCKCNPKRSSKTDLFYLSIDGPVKQLYLQLSVNHAGNRTKATNAVNGLVCFYDGNRSSLYNIATRETMQLPVSSGRSHDTMFYLYHFGFDRVNKMYKLLKTCAVRARIGGEYVRKLVCEILTIGTDSSWRRIASAPHCAIKTPSVCINSVLYWMVPTKESMWGYPENHQLVSFDLAREKFEILSPYQRPAKAPEICDSWPDCAGILAVMSAGIGELSLSSSGEIYSHRPMICSYGGAGDSSGAGVWVEHILELPGMIYHVPVGIFPDGKWLMFDYDVYSSAVNFCLYDQTNKQLEQILISEYPPCSTSSSSVPSEGLHLLSECMSYHEENIIPLRYLSSSYGSLQ